MFLKKLQKMSKKELCIQRNALGQLGCPTAQQSNMLQAVETEMDMRPGKYPVRNTAIGYNSKVKLKVL